MEIHANKALNHKMEFVYCFLKFNIAYYKYFKVTYMCYRDLATVLESALLRNIDL